MRSVQINRALFIHAFERDVDYHDEYPQSVYLDVEKGVVIWVFEEDEDADMAAGIPTEENRALRERIDATPDRYLEIPGLDHGVHHDILREFLNSDWTEDKELRSRARQAYSGSIGRWIRTIDRRDIVHAYYDFRDSKVEEMVEEFLREHDIHPLWQ
jgi:uncharacterized protein involved in copper resistance